MAQAVQFDRDLLIATVSGEKLPEGLDMDRWANNLQALAEDVETRWGILSEDQRSLLIALAAPRLKPEPWSRVLIDLLLTPVGWLFELWQGPSKQQRVGDAIRRLMHAIKEADERSKPEYQARTTTAVSSALAAAEAKPSSLTPSEFRDWLARPAPHRPK